MHDENEHYQDGVARTNKLYCSTCGRKITAGEHVVFLLNNASGRDRMEEVWCEKCGKVYAHEVTEDACLDDAEYEYNKEE